MALRCQPFTSNALSTSTRARFSRQALHIRPQASSTNSRPVAIYSASAAQQEAYASLSISQLALLGAPAVILYALPAFSADDLTVDAAYEAVQQQSAGSTDLVVSVLAAIVFTLLVVVTAGVAYLAIKSWLDERQEKQDKEYRPLTTSSPAATSSFEEKEERKRVRAKREKKGFGSSR